MFLNILFAVIKGMLELDGIQLDPKLPSASEPCSRFRETLFVGNHGKTLSA
ncbi:MAG: hypothetical protein U5L01_16155 [Rheinheimera sp.]|nr:hypothetical protein [Rheinheimera sp.]